MATTINVFDVDESLLSKLALVADYEQYGDRFYVARVTNADGTTVTFFSKSVGDRDNNGLALGKPKWAL